MKNYLRASSLLFNQPLLVTPDMLDLGVRWANQAMSLNIINIGAVAGSGLCRMMAWTASPSAKKTPHSHCTQPVSK